MRAVAPHTTHRPEVHDGDTTTILGQGACPAMAWGQRKTSLCESHRKGELRTCHSTSYFYVVTDTRARYGPLNAQLRTVLFSSLAWRPSESLVFYQTLTLRNLSCSERRTHLICTSMGSELRRTDADHGYAMMRVRFRIAQSDEIFVPSGITVRIRSETCEYKVICVRFPKEPHQVPKGNVFHKLV